MKRDWYKYILKNKHGSDCQLVSLVNGYYYLTGKTITSKRYLAFAEECHCITGACITVRKAYKKLGITRGKTFKEYDLKHKKKFPLPLEATVWHPNYGYHSVLIVDYEKKTDALRVTNFKAETNSMGWIFAEKFFPYLDKEVKHLDGDNEVYKTEPKEYGYRRELHAFTQLELT